jgi:hypothetical protein
MQGIIAGNAFSISIIDISFTPAEVATITAPAQTVTVPGVKTTDAVFVNPPGQTAGVSLASARVSADNTVSLQFVNPTAGALTPTAGVHRFTVIRYDGTAAAKRVLT